MNLRIKMRYLLFFLLALLYFPILSQAQEPISLYGYSNGDFPFSKIDANRPILTVFALGRKATGAAVIICSGGSYGRRANQEEGLPAAKLFAKNGITTFLLDYRLPNGHDSIPFADAQASIRYVRKNARKYHIHKDKIGIMGFSAGGHLAATVTTHFKEHFDNGGSAVSARPDFAVLVYPVISMEDNLTHNGSRNNLLGRSPTEDEKNKFSNELQVEDETPPVYIVHAIDDPVVKIDNTLLFIAALRQHRVPVETFIYAQGGHGFGVNNKTVQVQWTVPCLHWINKITTK